MTVSSNAHLTKINFIHALQAVLSDSSVKQETKRATCTHLSTMNASKIWTSEWNQKQQYFIPHDLKSLL